MKRYAYTLAECDMNAELHEFIDASDRSQLPLKAAIFSKVNSFQKTV